MRKLFTSYCATAALVFGLSACSIDPDGIKAELDSMITVVQTPETPQHHWDVVIHGPTLVNNSEHSVTLTRQVQVQLRIMPTKIVASKSQSGTHSVFIYTPDFDALLTEGKCVIIAVNNADDGCDVLTDEQWQEVYGIFFNFAEAKDHDIS